MGAPATGNVKMKCMLWEPQPILQRILQDQAYVYNADTMQLFPDEVTRDLTVFNGSPSGIYLREKYIYRDTFLRIGQETLNSDRADMRDSVGEPLFSTDGTPFRPYVWYQSFTLAGSLYSANVATTSGIKNGSIETLDNGLSKWTYEWADCPYDDGGNEPEEPTSTSTGFLGNIIQDVYTTWRKNRRLMPLQVAVSTEQKIGTSGFSGSSGSNAKPIHWLAMKDEPLFQGQDFWVEFRRRAYSHDVVSSNQQMLDAYKFLDVRTAPTPIGCGTVPINAGVVDVDADGKVSEKSRNLFDLHAQPYYLIEIGHRHKDHNYFILLAYNAHPVFIHAGQFPVIVPSGDQKTPPTICAPDDPSVKLSRRLSVFEISCKQLMDQPNLRITVRNHQGRIVVVFSGHEDKPWVISRSDLTTATTDKARNDFTSQFVPMIVPNAPIQIGAGNMKVGFLFGPLHYVEFTSFNVPQAICVRGPVTDEEVSLYLREKATQTIQSKEVNRYFQDAEVYLEMDKGNNVFTEKVKTLTPQERSSQKAPGKNTFPADMDLIANADGDYLSFISIEKTSDLVASQDPSESQDQNSGQTIDYVKFFNAKYTLGAGDYTFSTHTNAAGKNVPEWSMWNCLTPIANGWRLYVPPNSVPAHQIQPIDVAHHVAGFSSNYSYTDNTKVEHSGSIRFLLNFGQQTGTVGTGTIASTGDPASAAEVNGPVDYGSYIASLNDKTFFIRVYAWWENGYMACDQTCPCKVGANPGSEYRVLFTGLCHGGEISVRGTERFMECQLLDYMKILQDSQFLNSPFFDGMRDFNACYEILQGIGFCDTAVGSQDLWPPAAFIKELADSKSPKPTGTSLTGVPYSIPEYALPSSYNILEAPFFKMPDGGKMEEAITRIATLAGKVAYFDRYGVFHLDQRPDIKWLSSKPEQRKAKCQFFASPKDVPVNNCKTFDVLALNQYTYKRGTADVVNEIHMLTTTPDGEVLTGDSVNLPGKYDPTKPGYVGYTKRILQFDGIFGNQQALNNVVKYYEGFYIPPIIVNWESMGFSSIQAMDIVSFTGLRLDDSFPPNNNPQTEFDPPKTVYLIITSMSTDINPEKNTWTNKYEGEWIFTGALPPLG